MNTSAVIKPVDEMVIRLRSDATILVEKHTGEFISTKFINQDDLFSCIKDSCSHIGIESGILPENAVFYREEQDKTRRLIIKVPCGHYDITYHDTLYSGFPLPVMAFGFTIRPDGHISAKKLAIVEEGKLRNDSKLYYYPFSNVSQNTFDICTGRNHLPEIKSLQQLSSLPYFILSMPNNDDYFDAKCNRLGIGYRELLEHMKDKEPQVYYEEVLEERGITFDEFIKTLKS